MEALVALGDRPEALKTAGRYTQRVREELDGEPNARLMSYASSLRGTPSRLPVIADEMIVASGRSNRHVGAIADQLVEKLKQDGRRGIKVEGMPNADWVLVDAGDVIVHIFRPEVRSFYNLEKLWSDHAPDERIAV